MGWLTSVKEFATDAARTVEVATQGVVKGLGAGAASLGDLAVNVAFKDDENKLESYNPNLAGHAAEALTWTEPKNDYERAVMAGGQVVGEVGTFVAITVATAGVGGAAVGATAAVARGGTVAARAVSTGSQAATATARFLNPLASKTAAVIEGGFGVYRGHDLYTTDQAAEAAVDDIYEDVVDGLSDSILNEQQDLQETLQILTEQTAHINARFDDPNLSIEEEDQLLNRLDEINEAQIIIKELRTDIPEERREELHKQLDVIQPNLPSAPEDAENTNSAAVIQSEENDAFFSEDFSEDMDGLEVAALLENSIIGQKGDINYVELKAENNSAPNMNIDNTNTMLKV